MWCDAQLGEKLVVENVRNPSKLTLFAVASQL